MMSLQEHQMGMLMFRLSLVLFLFIGTTLAGIGVVAALSMGWYDTTAIIATAAAGTLVAIPFSWIVARRLQAL